MANLYDTGANSAFNEDKYINKLYDNTVENQKKVLQQGYDQSVQQLTTGQQATNQQTEDYLRRAYVEGERAAGNVQKSAGNQTAGAGSAAQAALTIGNQNQKNQTALQKQQQIAEEEYQRARALLGQKFEAQIREATANGDMDRATALYEAAKAEEEQLRANRQNAATMMANKGDSSIMEAIGNNEPVTVDTTSETWDSVLKNEEAINKIYDAKLEGERAAAETANMEALSALEAQQQAGIRETDQALNDAYVNALLKNQNYQETQTAYGQGSGTAMQARLAREAGLTEDLTNLRKLQLAKDAGIEQERASETEKLWKQIAAAQQSIDSARNKELYSAAEQEEQALIADQLFLGQQLAAKGDYSVLAQLYGLSPEQIAALTPKFDFSGYYGGGSGWGAGIDTNRNTAEGGLKGSAWDYTMANLNQLMSAGNYKAADKYMGMVSGQMNQDQYNQAMSVVGKAYK